MNEVSQILSIVREIEPLVGKGGGGVPAPEQEGTEGQVLTLAAEGKTVWATPTAGGIEVVNVHLTTEDGALPQEEYEVAVSVEGETEERFYTLDENGKCQFKVNHGLQYTIAFPTIEGYHDIADLVVRASLPVRNIEETYRKDESVVQEHVVATLRYQDGGDARATTVSYIISGSTEVHLAPVVNNVAEFDIPLGSNYQINFQDVDGYATPHSHSYFAEVHNRKVYAYYLGASAGLSWIKKDGSTVNYNEVTAEMKEDLLGLRVASATLIQANACFVVPLDYLLGEKTLGGKQWCTQNVGFSTIPNITSESVALKAENADGYNNTMLVLEEAAANSRTVPAFTACQSVTATVGDKELKGFLGSYAQMKTLCNNITNITGLCYQVFGKYAITVNSGTWWASTQYSSDAVYLYYGSFSDYYKTGSLATLPLFEL